MLIFFTDNVRLRWCVYTVCLGSDGAACVRSLTLDLPTQKCRELLKLNKSRQREV